jgi:predicted CXXCH cytochrome family protein
MPGRVSLAWLLLASVAGAQILRPTDHSAIPAAPISIVAPSGSKVMLDGKPTETGVPLRIAPGLHELTLDAQVVKFFAGPGAPPDFKPFRQHPPASTCDTCHVEKTGGGDVKAGACFACHDTRTFPKKHTHNAEVLEDCAACHSPHGSTAQFHLKLPKETACKLCHG